MKLLVGWAHDLIIRHVQQACIVGDVVFEAHNSTFGIFRILVLQLTLRVHFTVLDGVCANYGD